MHNPSRPRGDGGLAYELEVATAAHDLRNRLGIATCDVQQLRCRVSARLDARRAGISDCLASVERSLAHTNILLEGLLEIACSRTGVLVADHTTLDLVPLLSRLIEMQRCCGGRPRVVLVASVPRLEGAWDEARLTLLVRKLLTNAVQYSPDGGEVVVTLDRQAEEAVLRVADQGIGIPAADMPRIFEPFFRARNAERVAPGLGLGLATARLIVEQYAGSLEAESTEGVGTAFTVRLPLVSG